MEHRTHDLILINRNDMLPKQLPEFLHAKGFSSTLITDLNEIYDVSKRLRDPILLVGAGQNSFAVQKFLEDLQECRAFSLIQEIPIILVGPSATRMEPLLGDLFKLFATLESPCTNGAVFEQLEYLASMYRGSAPHFEVSHEQDRRSPVSLNSSIFNAPNTEAEAQEREVVPQLFFEEICGTLGELSLNGEKYCMGQVTEDYIKSLGYFDLDAKTLSLVDAQFRGCDKWSRLHLCRVAFITAQISQFIKFKDDTDRFCVTAAFLYPIAFVQRSPSLLRMDYLQPGRREERQRLSNQIQLGATLMDKILNSEELKVIFESLAALMGEKDYAHNSDLSLVAEMILVADLCDRICFRSGVWDPRAAQSLLHRIKKGYFFKVHKEILLCMIKFLTEAVLAKTWRFLLPKDIRRNMALIEQARRHKEMRPEKSELRVPLSSLRPGMRLSQPVLAFDGRMILDSDLKLDPDLIWRLWELAAKRPLNSPVIVGR